MSDYRPACPQHQLISEFAPNDLGLGNLGRIEGAFSQSVFKQSEDCLSINIQRPNGTKAGDNLPVLMWIHGGGFEAGASSSIFSEQSAVPGVIYQGANLVKSSSKWDNRSSSHPSTPVSTNFGFSASKELADAGLLNLGLEDQSNAVRWVKKHIASFGGTHCHWLLVRHQPPRRQQR